LRGGIVLFYFGFRPESKAFLACIINFSMPPSSLTILMKLTNSGYESYSSTPSLHFTVTGILTYFFISEQIFATSLGSNINIAPKQPSFVF
jgi:hypothetical protein